MPIPTVEVADFVLIETDLALGFVRLCVIVTGSVAN
jgi:hypothetical protein